MASGRIRLVPASVLAEVCYLYPIYLLITTSLGVLSGASPWWIIAMAAAAVMSNLVLSLRRRRLLTIVLVNLALSFFAAGWLIHHTFFSEYPFVNFSWVAYIFSMQNGFVNMISYWLTAIIALWVWCRATLLTRRPPAFTASVNRFDLSLLILFGIFLIASLAGIPFSGGLGWLLASLLSNSVAMSSAQPGSRLEGHPVWLGPAFLALLLVPATLVVTFLFSHLSMIGNTAYGLCLPIVRWLGYVMTSALVWLLKRGHMMPESTVVPPPLSSGAPPETGTISSTPAWMPDFLQIIGWLAVLLGLLSGVAIAAYLIYLLLSRLWQRQEPASPIPPAGKVSLCWRSLILLVIRWMETFRLAALPWLTAGMEPVDSYRALLHWGKRRKHPRLGHETPYEYLHRLMQRFPEKQSDLTSITEYYISFHYGAKPFDPNCKGELKSAVRRLHLPLFK